MIVKGYKQTEVGIIPEDWNVKELDNVLKFGSGQDYKHLSKGSIPVYGTGGVMTFVNDYLYNGNSVGIGRKGTIDKPVFLSGKFWTVDTLFFTHSFLGVLPKFIYYNFLMIPWKEYNEASGVPSLNKNTLCRIKIPLPPTLKEQEAIAKVLTDTDNLIQGLENVIAKKKAIKKGAMQQLLTPPNKGGKRLPGFSGEWLEKSLGDVLIILGGGAFKSSESQTSGIKWLKIANVGVNNVVWKEESFLPESLIRENEQFLLRENDYVIALTRPLLGRRLKIAKLGKDDVPSLLNQRVGKVISIDENNLDFIFHVFHDDKVIDSLQQSMAGTDPPNLSNKGIYSIKHRIPKDKEEQEAIATILSDMDREIEALEVKKEKYIQLKKGLAQELLTGKTRLV